jgi:Cof subfamily protein (haloacid dehalogenase superfamily)
VTAAHLNNRWLIALDVDGTVLGEDGSLNEEIIAQIHRVSALGHEVTLATGRAAATTLPILDRLGLAPEFVVCADGAIILRRDLDAPTAYVRDSVQSFDPAEVLTTIKTHLARARYGVEDEDEMFFYSGGEFPDAGLQANGQRVAFEQLLTLRATRVVVISPDHDVEEFLAVVEKMGLRRVSYTVGWTAWLDIAPAGVNKAASLETVRRRLKIPRKRVLAIGDGRNDIEMLEWASESGRGVAMGQAPNEVRAAANEITGSVAEGGAATVLKDFAR